MSVLICREIVKSLMLDIQSARHSHTFRVDILRDADGRFCADLSERVYYRLTPSFDLPEPGWQADEQVWVAANHLLRGAEFYASAEECLAAVRHSLNHIFDFQNNQAV